MKAITTVSKTISKTILLGVCAGLVLIISSADARDTRLRLPLADALGSTNARAQLTEDIKLFFGKQTHPKPVQSFGSFSTNKKTNFFNKSDKEGCEWAFLSAMITLQGRARQLGGNAVINIKSNYKNASFESDTEYECGAGAVVGGVAFTGEVVKL